VLVGEVRSLTPMIRAACADSDKTRVIPASVIDALRGAGLFQLLSPREIGGFEIEPASFLDIVEAASFADGSVGWCLMIGGCYAAFGGLLPAAGAADIFGNPSTIGAGAFRPVGVAREVDGGVRVSGRWPFASGSSHATWFIAGCVVHRDGKPLMGPTGVPVMREAFVPASAVEIIDTWESTGLRGTASHDYVVNDVFVPDAHTMWFQEPPSCTRTLYRMPPIAMFASFIAAVPIGIARHAIEEFIGLARAKTPTWGAAPLAEKPVVQAALGRADAMVTASRRSLAAALQDLWSRVDAGHAPTLADRGGLWVAATHAAQGALEAIEILYSTAGASAVYATSALDRCLRDARTAVQHVCVQESNYELAGRQLLGGSELPRVWAIDYRGEDR
jgi:alkylation response protein AidB-like acyl-CoA dehydrogenase